MTESTFVSAEELRTYMAGVFTADGWAPTHPETDLRGTPIGDRAEVWEWDRLAERARRRVREHVKVMHCPEGWYSTGGAADAPSGGEICDTLLAAKWAIADGGDFPANFNRFHDEHPVVWVIKVRIGKQVRTLRYCDPELPEEYRPGAQREIPPPVKPRKKQPEPSYYATMGHYDRTGQVKLHYWYRVQRGRDEGKIRPWPPGRSHSGRLYLRDVPDADTCQETFGCTPREWEHWFWEDVKDVRRAAMREIEDHPEEAAARFAVLQSTCCCCGRMLTEDRSKAYGVGPECREGMSPERLKLIGDQAAVEHARVLREAS